jgi:hypothetical protein
VIVLQIIGFVAAWLVGLWLLSPLFDALCDRPSGRK